LNYSIFTFGISPVRFLKPDRAFYIFYTFSEINYIDLAIFWRYICYFVALFWRYFMKRLLYKSLLEWKNPQDFALPGFQNPAGLFAFTNSQINF